MGDEAVPAPGLRHDEAMLIACLAEHLAQRRHRLVEVVLLDDDVRPNCVEQRLLLEQLATVLDEIEQCVEHPRLQRNRLAVRSEQQPSDGIRAKPAEPIRHVHLAAPSLDQGHS